MTGATQNLTRLPRFAALWQRNLLDGARDDGHAIYRRLVDGYSEPHRHYHTLAHIEQCLQLFDRCSAQVGDADALEFALWFHDVILEPGNSDNEARSAELYLELSDGVQREHLREAVHGMIMATLHNGSSLDHDDAIYMVDIDLSSFGLPWDEFLRDSVNLRAESSRLGDEEYYLNQTAFQRSLLARPRFYLSDFFYQRFEQQARANLERYFDYLQVAGQVCGGPGSTV